MPKSRANNLYLTGYERQTIEEFIAKLKKNNISRVVDIREFPLSRKNGFSKEILKQELKNAGIKYTHLQKLGSPKPIRDELRRTGNYITFFKKYRAYIKDKHFELQKIIDFNKHETLCVMCFEKDCELCHRTIVADEILKRTPNLPVIPV